MIITRPWSKTGSQLIIFLTILIALCWGFAKFWHKCGKSFDIYILIIFRWKQLSIVRKKIKGRPKADCHETCSIYFKERYWTKTVHHWMRVDFKDFSDVLLLRGHVHVDGYRFIINFHHFRCFRWTYITQIKLWDKIKRLNLKDKNTWWEKVKKITARLAEGWEVKGAPLNSSNDVFISPHLNYLYPTLLPIRLHLGLMLTFQCITIFQIMTRNNASCK